MRKFTVGVITYNSEKYIKDLLSSISEASAKPEELILIDNGSKDKTLEYIKKYGSQLPIRLIVNEDNLGHSPALNKLIETKRTDLVVFQDHDTVVEKTCYENLLNEFHNEREKLFAVTAVIDTVSKYGGKRVYGQDLHYLISSLPRFEWKSSKVGIIPSTCVMVDMKKIGELRFDEGMFIYQNDYDFFYRARMLGGELRVCRDAIVLHKDGTPGVSGRKGQKYSSLRSFYINRNRWLFFLKNYSLGTLIVLSPAILVFEVLAFLFTTAKGNVSAYLKAISDLWEKIPEYMKLRKGLQRKRVVHDLDILSVGQMGLSESAASGFLKDVIKVLNVLLDSYFIFIKELSGALR